MRQPAGPGRQRSVEPGARSTCTASCSAPPTGSPTSSARWTTQTKAFLVACADTAAERWVEKDQGIWEVRGEPQHFLYSKVMCWVALDRAIALAEVLGASRPGRGLDRHPR